MKTIRIGLIGTGVIAHQHMANYRSLPGVEVVAACDINQAKLEAFCDQYQIPVRLADYRQLLQRDDLDAIDVCLHNNLHAPISIAVMAAGINCYCEKPMAGAYTDALAMKEAAGHFGVKFHIQLGMLYGSQVSAAKTLIDRGRLGKLYHARSYGYRRRGRPYVDGYAEKEFNSAYWAGHGALYDMGVYHISQLLYLLGLPAVDRVSGSVYQELDMDDGRRRLSGFNVEELGVGLVHFAGGLTMDIIESWAIHGGEFPLSSIHGQEGGLQFTEASHGSGRQVLRYFSEIEGYPAESLLDVTAEDYRRSKIDPHHACYQNSQAHWVGVLRGEIEPINTPEIALQTMLISEGIFLSDQLKREISADEIPELSQSIAVREQTTDFGLLTYPPHPFF
ncbi:MAG: Gfo/Idh/MocA family oxidoreductase [Clostridia bacterium]|nr:Gfo/Idh/MocA family oxidoreductase [Clostridia bacterium]